MNDLIQSGFDYAALPGEVAIKAHRAAVSIKLRLKRTVEDIIEIGRELTAIKAELPHGQFLPWIAAEFEMSDQTARNFMMVSEKFSDKFKTVLNFTPKVLYALAAPSTPDSIVEKALEKAGAGEKVTTADVKDWKAELDAERRPADGSMPSALNIAAWLQPAWQFSTTSTVSPADTDRLGLWPWPSASWIGQKAT